jgi:uncharacterized Fe-S cluster-containing protein
MIIHPMRINLQKEMEEIVKETDLENVNLGWKSVNKSKNEQNVISTDIKV